MAQSGTGQTAHTKIFICPWATTTTLATAIATEITLRGGGATWSSVFSASPGSTQLVSPYLRMPLIRIYTAATDGVLNDTVGATNAPLPQSTWFGPITLEDTSTLKYTGSSAATVIIEC